MQDEWEEDKFLQDNGKKARKKETAMKRKSKVGG
jgi:hypothetical protein